MPESKSKTRAKPTGGGSSSKATSKASRTPRGEKVPQSRPAEAKPRRGEKAAAAKPADVKAAAAKPAEVKAAAAKPAEVKAAAAKSAEVKAAAAKPAEVKAAAVKPAEAKAAVVKPAEVKAAAGKPAEAKAAAVKPAEAKAAVVKPAEVKAAAVKPAEVKAAAVKPAEAKPVAVKPVRAKRGEARKDRVQGRKPSDEAPAEAVAAREEPSRPDTMALDKGGLEVTLNVPLATDFGAEEVAPESTRAAEPARTRSHPRVDVTAFPRRARPPPSTEPGDVPAPARQAPQAAEPVEPGGTRAQPGGKPAAPAPEPPRRAEPAPRPPSAATERAPALPQAPERAPPASPPMETEAPEVPEVLVEGFFLTPAPRFRQVAAEPVSEGFFLARVAGERAARLHGLLDRSGHIPPGGDENLGELPVSYGEDDDVLALPRDPHSFFVFWDFQAATATGAAGAVLRVYDGDQLVREVEFEPERRSIYLHDLPAGKTYRLEAHLVEASGARRLIGQAKLLSLPGEGSMATAEVRFLKLPWDVALATLRDYLRDGRAQVQVIQGKDAFSAWIRSPLPSSAVLHQGILAEAERVGLGPGPEVPGYWRPTPSGQSWTK